MNRARAGVAKGRGQGAPRRPCRGPGQAAQHGPRPLGTPAQRVGPCIGPTRCCKASPGARPGCALRLDLALCRGLRGHDSYLHKLLYLEFGTCILSLVLLQEQDSARLWSLWAKAGAVGNAQRCPRQVRRCAAGASSTNPPPASVWRCSSASSGDEPVVDPVTELGAQRQSLIGSPNGCLGASVAPVQFACSTRMGV